MAADPLELTAGRPLAPRRDSRHTRRALVDGIGSYAQAHGRPPTRLADVAAHAGVSTATAYRHFASLDDLAAAHLARLPEHAVALFARRPRAADDPDRVLQHWNECWVAACLAHGGTAVVFRSPHGFLRRRAEADPLIRYVCAQVEPLLAACGAPVDLGLAVWNAVSDPREVLDLHRTLGFGARRIASHVTRITLATRGA